MSTLLSPDEAELLKRRLAAQQYPAEVVAEKTLAVYKALLRESPRIRASNFNELAEPDLALLFDLYDARFFDGGLRASSMPRLRRSCFASPAG